MQRAKENLPSQQNLLSLPTGGKNCGQDQTGICNGGGAVVDGGSKQRSRPNRRRRGGKKRRQGRRLRHRRAPGNGRAAQKFRKKVRHKGRILARFFHGGGRARPERVARRTAGFRRRRIELGRYDADENGRHLQPLSAAFGRKIPGAVQRERCADNALAHFADQHLV